MRTWLLGVEECRNSDRKPSINGRITAWRGHPAFKASTIAPWGPGVVRPWLGHQGRGDLREICRGFGSV
ncbi:MAG: hypothetical protein ABI024_08445, partial [Vicinamibacterales bacterium]